MVILSLQHVKQTQMVVGSRKVGKREEEDQDKAEHRNTAQVYTYNEASGDCMAGLTWVVMLTGAEQEFGCTDGLTVAPK